MYVSALCPVCNGLSQIDRHCPTCGVRYEDQGRLGDVYGPYSPYRPIDDLKLTNGFPDLALQECVHLLHCPVCGEDATCRIKEKPSM